MELASPDEHRLLRDTVRAFIERHLRPHEAAVDAADDIDPGLLKELRQEARRAGLYGYNMPVELGGPGLMIAAQCVIDEEMGSTSMPLGEAIGHLPGSLRACDEEQREWLLKPVMAGEMTVAYALTEPAAGSDLSALQTRAEKVDGGWRLTGSKQFISNAEHADYIIVLAVTDRSAPLKSKLTTFLVDRHNPGLVFTRRFRKMGWKGYHLSAFSLENCFIPDANVLGGVGEGFKTIMATVNNDRLFVACRCIGIGRTLMEYAIPYARERVTFGKPLAEHQAIQFQIADCDVELDAARLLAQKAAHLADAGDPGFRIAASRAKLFASETAGRIADRVLQIFGGAGFMCDLPIERFYRDVRGFRIGEGTSEMQRIQIARSILA
ncbi:acyl-CoA dehydrogenase family protein [Rhodoligotrophos ferricapiens]|uniref:acyl-CoA dehydrogenase family protein n=1 Tax=Rhodoligotrophos ferricapiens TaxID=3069264 RepID=UPI00315D13B5